MEKTVIIKVSKEESQNREFMILQFLSIDDNWESNLIEMCDEFMERSKDMNVGGFELSFNIREKNLQLAVSALSYYKRIIIKD